MKKTILILIALIFIFGIKSVSPVLFQEGNPIPILKGIAELSFSDKIIVQVSDKPKKYLSKTGVGNTPLIELMKNEGWSFKDQLGAGYIFSKDKNELVIISAQYTRMYRIWKFSNKN